VILEESVSARLDRIGELERHVASQEKSLKDAELQEREDRRTVVSLQNSGEERRAACHALEKEAGDYRDREAEFREKTTLSRERTAKYEDRVRALEECCRTVSASAHIERLNTENEALKADIALALFEAEAADVRAKTFRQRAASVSDQAESIVAEAADTIRAATRAAAKDSCLEKNNASSRRVAVKQQDDKQQDDAALQRLHERPVITLSLREALGWTATSSFPTANDQKTTNGRKTNNTNLLFEEEEEERAFFRTAILDPDDDFTPLSRRREPAFSW